MRPPVASGLTARGVSFALPAGFFFAFLLLPGGAPGRAAVPGEFAPAQADDAALDGGMVRLQGAVRDAQGSPARDARVMASGRQVHREVSSRADGTFVLESLPPGVYTVQAVGSGASSQPTRVTIHTGVEPPTVLLILEAAQQVQVIAAAG